MLCSNVLAKHMCHPEVSADCKILSSNFDETQAANLTALTVTKLQTHRYTIFLEYEKKMLNTVRIIH